MQDVYANGCTVNGTVHNESPAFVEGVSITSLVDSGANMTAITKSFAQELQLEIKSLQTILDIEATGGGMVPYHGYVKCRLKIPMIEKFDLDVLMLVIDDSPYGMRVPVQIGTLHIDTAMELATEEEKRKLNKQWKRAQFASSLQMASANAQDTGSKEPKEIFSLDQVKGSVHLTKEVELEPFENVTLSGLLKGPEKQSVYCKRVNVAIEPLEEHKEGDGPFCAVPSYTFLKPGSQRVQVMIKNITARAITVQSGERVARVEVANAVPHMLAPNKVGEGIEVVSKAAKVEDQTGPSNLKVEPEGKKPQAEVNRTPLSAEQIEVLLTKIEFHEGTKDWSPEQSSKAREVLEKYSFLFAMKSTDLGRTDLVKHHIDLENYTPIKDCYRQIPPHQYEEVRKHLKEMLDIGVIRRSDSPLASPVVLVRKKDGSLRFCIDLRKLNARTVKDAYAIPRIEDALDSLNGACIFTSFDLKSGYWQVELDDESIPLTAFTMGPLGFYKCVRMPFGLTNAPATFQRLMESCLGDLHLNWCIIYLDDIIIFSKNPDDHITRLEGVFEKLVKAGLKLKPSKCEFFKVRLKYLGHIVSPEGIATDPVKIAAIVKWPRPKTVTDVRSFTGFTNYYRKFIKGYAKIAHPLHKLTSGENSKRKHKPVEWDERCQESFEALKKLCSGCPVLAYADYKRPFVLHTDTSTTGLGAVLYQKQEDGMERVIAYASRTLNRAERNYDAHKLEFLALKWAVTDLFHKYLYGATFDVFTDNNPLTYILTIAKLDATGHRWVASLGPYNFNLHCKPGKQNSDADALSRIDWMSVEAQEVRATMDLAQVGRSVIVDPAVFQEVSQDNTVMKSLRTENATRKWQLRQQGDPEIKLIIQMIKSDLWTHYRYSKKDSESMKSYVKVRSELVLHQGLLYRKLRLTNRDEDTYQFVVPTDFRKTALSLAHDSFGHLGIDRTTVLMTDRFYWPRMSDEVRKYIQNCERCTRFKQQPHQDEMVPLDASYPLQTIHMDFLQIGSKKDKNTNVLVITDHFTRYAQAFVTNNQKTATVVKTFIDKYVVHYGWPEQILTDQGQSFEGHLFKDLCKEAQVRKMRTSPYHPMGNGQPERFNRTLLTMLGTLPNADKADWQNWVNHLTHAYNCTKSQVTGFSPYFLMFGREPRIPVDETFEVTFPFKQEKSTRDYVNNLRERLHWAYQVAKEHITKDVARRKLYYD